MVVVRGGEREELGLMGVVFYLQDERVWSWMRGMDIPQCECIICPWAT